MNRPATGGAGELRPLPVLTDDEKTTLLERAVYATWDSLGCPLTDAAEEAFAASVDVRYVLACLTEQRNRDWAARLGEAIARDIVLGAEWLPDVVFHRVSHRTTREKALEKVASFMPAGLSPAQQTAWLRRAIGELR